MSKRIALIPLQSIERLEIVVTNCRKSLAQVKGETGADYILNGGMWNPDGSPCRGLKVSGKLLSNTPWGNVPGYAWDAPGGLHLTTDWQSSANFIAVSPMIRDGKALDIPYAAAQGGKRGRSAMGLVNGCLGLYCSSDGSGDASTPEELQKELLGLGWYSAMMLDGGGSSQCDFDSQQINAARKVHNWICVWLKESAKEPEDKEESIMSKIVCLDPGHGPGNVNGSPDGAYKEHEFTWDLYTRLKPLLEQQGVKVVCTRTQDQVPGLTARANVSNRAGADLFVSLHSNATGGGGWSSARGFVAYTSSGPESAERNQAAVDIINAVKAQGVVLFGTGKPYHELFTVLTATTAPAVLLECGFHTNQEDVALLSDSAYRDKLAAGIANGILTYLGMDTVEQPESGEPDQPSPWAKEAWELAVKLGIFDGTNPQGPLTREQAAVILDRLGLLEQKGGG